MENGSRVVKETFINHSYVILFGDIFRSFLEFSLIMFCKLEEIRLIISWYSIDADESAEIANTALSSKNLRSH